MFRVSTDEVEKPLVDEDRLVEEIQAMGFAGEKIRKHFFTWISPLVP